ncbi:hypothetical protein BCR34DRAFT_601599 [Clohesyomyces aquaticus]|uniref:Uncharacterized protein n=1 Tax=Clohesyomyces aquaticus TaxID=1231657 RepID=A0A1Y1ZLN3_9PLEO|nr:hypothetical protein BCR34DRAFT_601599 [Clohesyomyces aquaticus]
MSGYGEVTIPILHGPLYPITPVMHVTGVRPEYSLIAEGTLSGILANYYYPKPGDRPLSDQWIPFDILPREGEYITVRQTKQFRAGGPDESGTTPPELRIQVQALPKTLPPTTLLTPVHICSDYISLGGIIPGAWIHAQLESGANLVSEQARKGAKDRFHLNYNGPLPGGVHIVVWQSVTEKGDSTGDSKKLKYLIEDGKFKEPLAELQFYETPKTCYNEIALANMLDSAYIRVVAPDHGQSFDANNGNVDSYKFAGWLPQAVGAGEPYVAEAYQSFDRCKLKSSVSKSPTIIKTPKLGTPKVSSPLCDDKRTFTVGDLATGQSLWVTRLVNGQPAPDHHYEQRIEPIPGPSVEFQIPENWPLIDPAGAVSFEFVQKGIESCSVASDISEPLRVTIGPPSGSSRERPVLSPGKMYYCSNVLRVDKVTIGASLQILSDNGRMLLPRPIDVTESPMVVHLPGRIYEKTELFALETSCHTGLFSNRIPVVPYEKDRLPDPTFAKAPMAFSRKVDVAGLVPGARAYVVVNSSRRTGSGKLWSQEVDVISERQEIPLNEQLRVGNKVGIVQYLCDATDSSNPSPTGRQVRLLVFPPVQDRDTIFHVQLRVAPFDITAQALQWNINHPQLGPLVAKIESFGWGVDLEYDAQLRHQDVYPGVGFWVVQISVPNPRHLIPGWVQISGKAHIVLYKPGASTPMPGMAQDIQLNARFLRDPTDSSDMDCFDWDVTFTYASDGKIGQWKDSEVPGPVSGLMGKKTC